MRQLVFTIIIVAIILVVSCILIRVFSGYNIGTTSFEKVSLDYRPVFRLLEQTTAERNEVSRLLNLAVSKIGELECSQTCNCENQTAVADKLAVASRGGWCTRDEQWVNRHFTDENLCRALAEMFTNCTVASFGDGPGGYKDLVESYGTVTRFHSYDGAPFTEEKTKGRVRFLDLSVPQYGLPLYDWILCLEVAEHIPAIYEDVLMANIRRHATKGLVMSWATVGQGGFSHVNEKNEEDVKKLLDKHGFELDPINTETIRNNSTISWLKNNIRVYKIKR